MSIIAGVLVPDSENDSQRPFSMERAARTFICDGFTSIRHWQNASIKFTEFKRRQATDQCWQLPAYFEQFQLAIIADARLSDRQNLVSGLGLPSDTPDIHLLLAAYRKWGVNCPRHVVGDYVFVIWDPVAQTLFCARDHMGAKPFYFLDTLPAFAFASDIRAILDSTSDAISLDRDWIVESFLNGHLYSMERTDYCNVKKLPPGHCLTITRGNRAEIHRYWRPEEVPALRLGNDCEYAEAMHEQVELAVADCVPLARTPDGHASGLGVHLSGGLDSSAVAALAIRVRAAAGLPKPEVFCWQQKPTEETELSPEHKWLQAMVVQEGLKLNYAESDVELMYLLFITDATRLPCTSTYAIEAETQRQARRKGIDVILSGWGGDEVCSHNGRSYNPWLFKTGQWQKLIHNLRDLDEGLLKSVIASSILPLLPDNLLSLIVRLRGISRQKKSIDAYDLLHPDLAVKKILRKKKTPKGCSVKNMQLYLLNSGHLTERIESWAIHGRMHGMEYRYPLLDRRLIEFSLSLPADQYRRGSTGRFIFRNAMRGVLPDAVVDNFSKFEPVRVAASLSTERLALDRIVNEIRSGELKPTRTEFIDMERLLQVLEGDISRGGGPVRKALRLLRFI